MNDPNVLFFSRDPGATNQLVAVHELLCSNSSALVPAPAIQKLRTLLKISQGNAPLAIIVGKKFALNVWRAAGIQAEDGADITPDNLIGKRNIALVITGTDDIDEPDTIRLWHAAQQARIPVAVFLDNLVNLGERFRTHDDTLITPDLVFALDHHSIASLAAAGIPENRLHTTNNLHFARLARIAKDNQGARAKFRKTWQAEDNTQVVLFAAENASEMAALGRPAPYDEHAILQNFIADLAQGRPIGKIEMSRGPILVVIRPHPRDTEGKYDYYIQNMSPTVTVSTVGTPLEAALAADLVVGMDSALLFEAAVLGRPAVSLVAESSFNKLATKPG